MLRKSKNILYQSDKLTPNVSSQRSSAKIEDNSKSELTNTDEQILVISNMLKKALF